MWGVQVAFNVFIPCMLFSKVASTLAKQPNLSLLAIPLVAVLQVPFFQTLLLISCTSANASTPKANLTKW